MAPIGDQRGQLPGPQAARRQRRRPPILQDQRVQAAHRRQVAVDHGRARQTPDQQRRQLEDLVGRLDQPGPGPLKVANLADLQHVEQLAETGVRRKIRQRRVAGQFVERLAGAGVLPGDQRDLGLAPAVDDGERLGLARDGHRPDRLDRRAGTIDRFSEHLSHRGQRDVHVQLDSPAGSESVLQRTRRRRPLPRRRIENGGLQCRASQVQRKNHGIRVSTTGGPPPAIVVSERHRCQPLTCLKGLRRFVILVRFRYVLDAD